MATRSRAVILEGGRPRTYSGEMAARFEFTGDGSNSVHLQNEFGQAVKAKLPSLQVFVSTQFYPPSWWSAEQGTDATIVTLSGSHTFPNGAPCTIYYSTEITLNL